MFLIRVLQLFRKKYWSYWWREQASELTNSDCSEQRAEGNTNLFFTIPWFGGFLVRGVDCIWQSEMEQRMLLRGGGCIRHRDGAARSSLLGRKKGWERTVGRPRAAEPVLSAVSDSWAWTCPAPASHCPSPPDRAFPDQLLAQPQLQYLFLCPSIFPTLIVSPKA